MPPKPLWIRLRYSGVPWQALFYGTLLVITLFALWHVKQVRDCERRKCPSGLTAHMTESGCLCVVLPEKP